MPCLCGRQYRFLLCLSLGVLLFCISGSFADGATGTASRPGQSRERASPHGHLFGTWGGERTQLEERGVTFDFQRRRLLWNLKSVQPERFASWNRFRWTVDIDFGKLTELARFVFPCDSAAGRAVATSEDILAC